MSAPSSHGCPHQDAMFSRVLRIEQCQVAAFVADDLVFLRPGIPDPPTELCPHSPNAC